MKMILAVAVTAAFIRIGETVQVKEIALGPDEAGDSPTTVNKVIRFLDQLLSKSQQEGVTDADIYAKFECWCSDNEKRTSAQLKDGTEDASKLESEIEALHATNGELSMQCGRLKADIADNIESQRSAEELRSSGFKSFRAAATDFQNAIGVLSQAIDILSAVGSDQTEGSSAIQFMAATRKKSVSLIATKKSTSFDDVASDLRQALKAAVALVPAEQRPKVDALLQAPFTGSYSSQSAGVTGILKNMRDTFKSNFESAVDTERKENDAHASFIENLDKMAKDMTGTFNEKQQELGETDSELAAKKLQLKLAKESTKSAEAFLGGLRPNCEKKATEFKARKLLRANEEAAIAEAISILGSDKAHQLLSQTASETNFLQLRAEQKVVSKARRQVQSIFQQASTNDNRFARLAELAESNSLTEVLQAIRNLINLIEKEQAADEEKFSFCKDQVGQGEANLKKTQTEVDHITDAMNALMNTIYHPQTGLQAQDGALDDAMLANVAAQKKETEMRHQENLQYQKNVKELGKAAELLIKTIKVLDKFYASLDEKSGRTPSESGPPAGYSSQAPHSFDGAYVGQSSSAGSAISMLEFILDDTKHQEFDAHKDEESAQADFEDSMAELTAEQKSQEKSVIQLKAALARAGEEMADKKQDFKQADKDKSSINTLLADLQPGCDFILGNFELRTNNRKLESEALTQGLKLLQNSPAYQAASAVAEAEARSAKRL